MNSTELTQRISACECKNNEKNKIRRNFIKTEKNNSNNKQIETNNNKKFYKIDPLDKDFDSNVIACTSF